MSHCADAARNLGRVGDAAKDGGDRSFVKDGFAVTEWTHNGLRFAAVSDIPPAELRQFEALFVKRSI